MPITEAFAGTQSVTTTEHSLPRDATYDSGQPQTGDGIYQVFVDVNAVAFGDEFLLKVYEKVQSSDTQRLVYQATITGPQAEPVFVTPALVLMHGWDVTIIRVTGTDRTITWSIRQIS